MDGRPVADASVASLLADGAARLAATSDTARLDAELLLAAALGVDRTRLVLDRREPVAADARAAFEALIARRAAHEPVAHLLGRRGFHRIELSVDGSVLVPRPETELLVELGMTVAPGSSVLDVGTGSGAIALALAAERPDLRVAGVDVSAKAIAVAEVNRSNLGLDVSFTVGDLLHGVDGPFDVVLANLPYVADDDPLPADVADWEPALALFGGADGLDVIRRLLGALTGRGWPALVGLEIGEAQGAAVSRLVAGAGFHDVEVRPDLAGRDRVVVGRRRSGGAAAR